MELTLGMALVALAVIGYLFLGRKKRDTLMTLAVIGLVLHFAVPNMTLDNMFSAAGPSYSGPSGVTATCDKQVVIESLNWQTKVRGSNSYTTASGTIKYFDPSDDPTDANANPIDSTTISSGVGSDTSKIIKTCRPYRVIFDGGDTYYSKDLGIITFDGASCSGWLEGQCDELNPVVDGSEYLLVEAVGTIDDMGDETATSGNTAPLVCNGQSTNNAAQELYGTADKLVYNETTGDGVVTTCVRIGCSGANKYCDDLALQFDWADTNAPEGNEISSIAVSVKEGTDVFGLAGKDLVNYWKNQGTIPLGNLKGGQYVVYQFTYTLNEANIDGNDGWYLRLDDNGGWQELDIGQDDCATGDSREWDYSS